MNAIEAYNVEKFYKNGVQALDSLSLTVRKGEIFSLLGKNGAGKSTLISILTTYLKSDTGTISILGKDILEDSEEIRSQIACVAQQTSIDTHLSLEENRCFKRVCIKYPRTKANREWQCLLRSLNLNNI